jgi:hypothetical protein
MTDLPTATCERLHERPRGPGGAALGVNNHGGGVRVGGCCVHLCASHTVHTYYSSTYCTISRLTLAVSVHLLQIHKRGPPWCALNLSRLRPRRVDARLHHVRAVHRLPDRLNARA